MKNNGRMLRAALVVNYPKFHIDDDVFGNPVLLYSLVSEMRGDFPYVKKGIDVKRIPLDDNLPGRTNNALNEYLSSVDKEPFLRALIDKTAGNPVDSEMNGFGRNAFDNTPDLEEAEGNTYRFYNMKWSEVMDALRKEIG